MELRVLHYFLAVVREENISKAAELLHVTQPTLSRQIAQLEEELGAMLFVRGRHLQLTDAGLMLKRRAEEVEVLIQKIDEEFAQKNELSGVISIGSGGLYSTRIFPEILAGFRQLHPKVRFQLYTNSAEYVTEQLEHGLLDFGMLLEPMDVTKFDYIRMRDAERWGLLLRRSHPLAAKPYITRDDLLGEPIITSNRPAVQRRLQAWLGDTVTHLDIFATYNIITHVVGLVDSGVASALTIEGAVHLFASDRLVFRPLYPELSMSSVFVWKRFQRNASAASAFLDYFKECLNRIEKN